MDFNIKTGQPEKQRADCLILPVFESGKLQESTAKLDNNSDGYIKNLIKMGDIDGKVGQTLLLHNLPNVACDRVLLVGCGKESEFSDKVFREIIQRSIFALSSTGVREAICYLTELVVPERDTAWKVQQAVVITMNCKYKFEQFKSATDKNKTPRRELKKLSFMIANRRDQVKAEQAIKIGLAIANGMQLIKDLANTPANICTPEYIAKAALKLAKSYKAISCAVLEKKDIQALKMGAFLSVTQGSPNPPKLISLEYRGGAKTLEPIVLVGKGITFDTGGNSIKPALNMIGMKYDMCGAATVLGALQFAADLELPINIVGVLAVAENMPGGTASRPDDIVTTMSGITVEILNTDAEGRLVLCDALTYCERFKPAVVIDMATLTGACVVALGNYHSGLFSNDQALANELLAAGLLSGDKCWQMPLTDEYQRGLDSNFADIANVGNGSDGGSIVAACFLSRFTKKYRWAHLDVAGTACRFTGKDKGATGQPLPLIAEYLLHQCK
jgi:leucyl aminopeptidase